MRFRALSPICVTRAELQNEKMLTEYLFPDHPAYEKRFFENLITRYKSVNPEINGQYDDISSFRLRPLNEPRSRLIKIKADTPQETRVRGWLYDFECHAPTELLKFGYDAGFGEKGSLGFGCVEVG